MIKSRMKDVDNEKDPESDEMKVEQVHGDKRRDDGAEDSIDEMTVRPSDGDGCREFVMDLMIRIQEAVLEAVTPIEQRLEQDERHPDLGQILEPRGHRRQDQCAFHFLVRMPVGGCEEQCGPHHETDLGPDKLIDRFLDQYAIRFALANLGRVPWPFARTTILLEPAQLPVVQRVQRQQGHRPAQFHHQQRRHQQEQVVRREQAYVPTQHRPSIDAGRIVNTNIVNQVSALANILLNEREQTPLLGMSSRCRCRCRCHKFNSKKH